MGHTHTPLRSTPPGQPQRLIEVGWCDTIRAADLYAGMHRMLNYGHAADVVAVEPALLANGKPRPGWLLVTFREHGKEYQRVMKATTRLVACDGCNESCRHA